MQDFISSEEESEEEENGDREDIEKETLFRTIKNFFSLKCSFSSPDKLK